MLIIICVSLIQRTMLVQQICYTALSHYLDTAELSPLPDMCGAISAQATSPRRQTL